MGRSRKNGRKSWEAECDRLFSILVRMKELMFNDKVTCYTCDKPFHFTEIHCGHFIPRNHRMTRWLEDNCRPQCYHCNVTLKGNEEEFAKRLDNEIPGQSDFLRSLKNATAKLSESDLKELAKHLHKRIDECGGLKLLPRSS